jgi:hypothetical protein
MWLLPRSGTSGGLGLACCEQVIGDAYVIFGVVVLVLAARFTPRQGGQPRGDQVSPATSSTSKPSALAR